MESNYSPTQSVENLPAMQETWVPSLGGEDPLEKEVATHSGILAWESHGQRNTVHEVTGLGRDLATKPPKINFKNLRKKKGYKKDRYH